MSQIDVRKNLKDKVYSYRLVNISKETGIPSDVLSKFMRNDSKELWPEHLEKLNEYLDNH